MEANPKPLLADLQSNERADVVVVDDVFTVLMSSGNHQVVKGEVACLLWN